MIKWLLRRAIGKFEREWKYDASYIRDMIDASPRAAWLFSRVTALGQFRRDLPIEPWCAAGITAVRHEDCGPCTQLAVTMAENETSTFLVGLWGVRYHVKDVAAPSRYACPCMPALPDGSDRPEYCGAHLSTSLYSW